jgi:hypothetical protein
MSDGKRWTVQDRDGREIYLTEERWRHITAPDGHPEMADYEQGLQSTIRTGRRTQDSLLPNKYYYSKAFLDLPEGNSHIIAVVLFTFATDENGRAMPNNFVTTAYQNYIYSR